MEKRAIRPPDGLLHASSHLTGSMRHAMLDVAGAPKTPSTAGDLLAVHLGDLWHKWAHTVLRDMGWPLMQEVKLTDYMPEGWAGTADLVVFHPQYRGFVLGDYKTSKGESFYYLQRDGTKMEHMWQVSAYFHALVEMGLPMVKAFFMLYWPKNDVRGEKIEPVIMECEPYPKEQVEERMATRWSEVQVYLNERDSYKWQFEVEGKEAPFLADSLAPVQERVQQVRWSKRNQAFELLLVPHWSAAYCPFPDNLCDCNTQGVNKIGQYSVLGEYSPRSGYESIEPTVSPSAIDYKRRQKEVSGR